MAKRKKPAKISKAKIKQTTAKIRKLSAKQFKQFSEEKELRQIEKMLGEEFETLREARKALRDQTQPKDMYRLTVAAPYYTRDTKVRDKRLAHKNSPISSSFYVRGWFTSQRQAQASVSRFTEKAEQGRSDAVSANRNSFSKDEPVNIAIQKVAYDKQLIDIEIEEENERV